MNLGILSIGHYIPEDIRDNSWWPTAIVNQWSQNKERVSDIFAKHNINMDDLSYEAQLVMDALTSLSDDPFSGAQFRPIMAKEQKTTDMEILAAKQALQKANISAKQIDFILCHSNLPDVLSEANACQTHKGLGLSAHCYSQDVGGTCNAFISQLFLAQSLIKSGAGKYGLLVQSSGASRYLPQHHPVSPLFGDAATAVVVGPVADNEGVLAISNTTNGKLGNFVVTGVPGANWYDDGKITMYVIDAAKGMAQNMYAVEQAKYLVEEALKKANMQKEEIDFYAGHQGMKWFRPVTQKAIRLEHAKTFDTFPMYSGLVASNIPLVLMFAQEKNLLQRGDNIASYSIGTGVAASGLVMRWAI